MKLMRVERNAFAASLTSSADSDVRAHDLGLDAAVELDDPVGVRLVEPADDDAVGAHEVATALPSARNSGFDT